MTDSAPAAPTFTAEELGKHCLVTGGAGYVGSAIVRRLVASGCRVRSLDAVAHQHDGEVECVTADLRDQAALHTACEGIDTVFHTVALIKIIERCRPALKRMVYEVNCTGTENILRAARDSGVTALVQTSTFNVVMDHVIENGDESLPYATRSGDLYTLTKVEAEKAVLEADGLDGLRTCALRPGGIWGADVNSMMIRSVLDEIANNNFKVLIGDGKSNIDNTHIENLVDAHLLAARGLRKAPDTVGGQAYFIVDNERANGLEWFRPLVKGLGENFPTFRLPGGFMRLVGTMMEWVYYFGGPEPTITRRGMRNLTESASFRIDKAQRDLGYRPRYNRANGIPELLPAARDYVNSIRNKGK